MKKCPVIVCPPPQRLFARPANRGSFKTSRRRGSVLIATIWVIIVLTALVITLSVRMRAAAMAEANRAAGMQAAAAERGAEQFLLAVIDQKMLNRGEGVVDTTDDISMAAQPLGNCYVWVIQPANDDDQTANPDENYSYGLTDEMAKIDINTAPYDVLEWLPGMTQEMAASIVVWRGSADPTGMGATDSYYESLPDPYRTKQAPFESVGELALVKDFTPFVLYGYDTNHNGVLDQAELQSPLSSGASPGAMTSAMGSSTPASPLGLFSFVSALPPAAAISAHTAGQSASSQIASVNPINQTLLRNVLTNVLGGGRANEILQKVVVTGPRAARFTNVFAFYYAAGMTPEEFTKVYPRITAGGSGFKVNIMTASREVLACLPGLQNNTGLVSTILTQRQAQLQSTTDPTNLAWLVNVPQLQTALTNTMGNDITGASTVYSGDIVAVTANGRAYRRCRVIIQAGDGVSTPSKIIYREDITSDGWPLYPAIRTALRAGQAPPAAPQAGINGPGGNLP